eukprot:2782578-Pyramimonas_sp.AAC.1
MAGCHLPLLGPGDGERWLGQQTSRLTGWFPGAVGLGKKTKELKRPPAKTYSAGPPLARNDGDAHTEN